MIYAPPSREKTKQTVRSPMLEKGKATSIGGPSQLAPSDEYANPAQNAPYQASGSTAGGQRKKQPLPNSVYQGQVQTMMVGGDKYQQPPGSRQWEFGQKWKKL